MCATSEPPAGFEPAISRVPGGCCDRCSFEGVAPGAGIEPAGTGVKALLPTPARHPGMMMLGLRAGSNRRPSAYKAGALPAELRRRETWPPEVHPRAPGYAGSPPAGWPGPPPDQRTPALSPVGGRRHQPPVACARQDSNLRCPRPQRGLSAAGVRALVKPPPGADPGLPPYEGGAAAVRDGEQAPAAGAWWLLGQGSNLRSPRPERGVLPARPPSIAVQEAGFEPARPCEAPGFEPGMSSSSITPARASRPRSVHG